MKKTTKEDNEEKCTFDCHDCKYYRKNNIHRGEAVYGLGIIGALFYYWGMASSFWLFALGLLKAFFWPAFLVYELFKSLNIGL
ncbi:MAG: hypothetical protein WA087_03055 [Candidatus Saccharimonadales bacterium]